MSTTMFALKVLWICTYMTVVLSEETESQNLQSLLKSALTACETETNIDLDELKSLSVSEPLSHDLSCYVDCVMRKFDLIDHDQFSVNKANIYVDKFMKRGDNSEEVDVKKSIVKRCADETKDETDSCLLSGAIFQCMGKEWKKAGFLKENDSHKISKRSDEDEKEEKKRNINFYVYSYYNFLMQLIYKSLGKKDK